METQIFDLAEEYDQSIKKAASLVKQGGIVVFPTETVYGLGANAYDKDSVAKIFEAKGRPSDNPLIVHIADLEDIFLAAREVSESAKLLIKAFMPGPISIILKKNYRLADNVTAGLDTVAVRCPSSAQARDFIKECACPIAAPSANISGKPSPTRGEHVVFDMNGRADAILIGDDCLVGLESTVVDMSGEAPAILRPGAVTKEMIEDVLGMKVTSAYKEELKDAPKAPGMKYTHYKPKASVVCVYGELDKVCEYITKRIDASDTDKDKIACIAFDEAEIPNAEHIFSLGSISTPECAAANLFASLRSCDTYGIELAFAMGLEYGGIADAYNNRLNKASDEVIYI